jgi:DNA-binding beta-propeller fold protein YncE
VKTVMHEVDRIAEITNQGNNMRIVFDDESSWPFTWYLRDYPNYGYLRGEAGSVDPSALDGAKVVIVGSKKSGDVRQILGDRFYEFDYIRLWWPMQEYFNLTYQRVANAFSTDADNVAARYYRQGMWDIWLNRDYTTYGQAMCIEDKQSRCENEASYGQNDQERAQFRTACQSAVVNECRAEPSRFAVNNWPVSDRLYFFVDKQIAAQVWDAGIGSSTVNIREPEYAEDKVYTDRTAQSILGETAGLTGARGIVVAQDGLIYVTVPDLNRIVVLNDKGEQVRQIGSTPGGTNEAGSLRQPWGLDIGPDGNLYVADTWNHRIQVFTPDGAWLRMWGHEGVMPQDVSPDAFWGPRDVKIGPDGNVYVADTGNKRIRVYTLEGRFLKDIGSFGTALGQLDEPVGLAFNPVSGELYVAEAWNKRIQAFDRNGFPLRTWPVNLWFTNRQSYNRPYLAVSPDGTLVYVSDMDDRHRVVAYDLNGVPIISFNQPDNLEANLIGMRAPAGLAFDEAGRLYVTDSDQGKVYVFPPSEVTGGIPPQPPVQEPGSAEATEQPLEPPAADVTESATEPAAG